MPVSPDSSMYATNRTVMELPRMPATKHSPEARPESQKQRFIKAAREAGASEDEREFDENLKRIAKVKPKDEPKK
jgi:hypothetical protein